MYDSHIYRIASDIESVEGSTDDPSGSNDGEGEWRVGVVIKGRSR